ncbi:hypothetical protein AGMMS49982_06690 [Bacteroidia bacterium]|nr:hypothetical protein AGMMS49982_06690 [Bacteroidia bacterium]
MKKKQVMKKRSILSFCAVATLLLGTGAANAATGSWTSGSTTVVLTADSTLTISGTGAMENYSVFAPWDPFRADIKTVVINEGVTTIGEAAFYDCSNITGALTIPNSVTSIGEVAFYDCSGLTGALTIPDNVISIGNEAFKGCSGLNGALTIGSSVASIGQYAFENCSGLTGALTIPNSVTSIGNNAFENCSGLSGVLTIPNTVTSIEQYAFNKCSGLTGTLTIPNSVTSIGNAAFAYCSGLDALTIGDGVTSIAGSALYGCNGLTAIAVNASNAKYSSENGVLYNKIKDTLLMCPASKSGALTIPTGVTGIKGDAFSGCSGLTGTLTIPNGVTSIENSTFYNCYGFTALTIGSSVTSIGDEAFKGCSGLTGALTIPNSVTSIEQYAFSGCRSSALTIPNGVTRIEEGAFFNCSGLTSVFCFATTPPTLGSNNFTLLRADTLYVPESALSAYTSNSSWNSAFGTILANIPATGVSLDKTTTTLTGGTEQLTASILPANATTQKAITWSSSDIGVVKVNEQGLVTVVASGTATITVTTEGGFTATCVVTVSIPVTSVSLDKTTATLLVGGTKQLTESILPSGAANTAVTWSSSDSTVATVSTSGLVTAESGGTATITATTVDGGFTATCVVTAASALVESISLDKTTVTLSVDSTEQLTASILPANATNKAVTWSSNNPAVAMVTQSGLVMTISTGTAIITATTNDGGFTATCVVTVVIPVTSVSLDRTTATVSVGGDTEQLTASISPADATNTDVTWSSSNPTVATVSTSGVVTAESAGAATITATTADGGFTAMCVVTVPAIPVTGISLDKTTATLSVGDTEQLTASILPANATNVAVTWSSNNPAATVSTSGVVTAESGGTATITATTDDGGFTATCVVTVVVPVTSVSLNKSAARLSEGDTMQLTASILPADATNKALTWHSSGTAVATVSANGLVTAVLAGTATITATTDDGGRTATCEVTVAVSSTAIKPIDTDKLQAYPNPTTGIVHIKNANGAEVQVYTQTGELLHRTRESQVDLSGYPGGVYLLRVGDETVKVVKK